MKFGTLYSYWGTKWQCDYLKTLKRVSDIGFDILEMGAPHLLEMSDYELSELRRAAKDMDMVLTANIGPAKDKDLASPDPDIRKAGVNYLIDILKAMEKVGSKSLVGAMYSYWPCQFEITDKEAAWERSIEGMKEVAEAAESLGIECCQEVLNRYETYIITDCREGLEYCRRVGSENVNLLLDTFHMNIEEDDMVEAAKKINEMYHCAVLCKGGHSLNDANDLLYQNGKAISDMRKASLWNRFFFKEERSLGTVKCGEI